MVNAALEINQAQRERRIVEIGIGIGANTGNMCVGDRGSNMRGAYAVIGDSANLAARLEGIAKAYGVDIVGGDVTKKQTIKFAWSKLGPCPR